MKQIKNITSLLYLDFDNKRNYGLDILRALAIFFVLNVHSAHFFKPDSTLFKALTIWNLDGVTLFFVLSGFLIGGILIRMFENGEVSVKSMLNFWKRRWLRTLPNYFLVLTVLLILGLCNNTVASFWQVKSYYYFLANFKAPMPDYLFPEAWSLSVEEWFYLLIPACMFMLASTGYFKPRYVILTVITGVIIFSTGFRYYRLSCWPGITENLLDANFRKQVITRMDSIMFGVLGAFLSFYHSALWNKYKKPLFFLGIFLLYFNYTQYLFGYFGKVYAFVFSEEIRTIGFLCLFPYLTELKTGEGFIYKQVTRLSLISYSVYLLNYSIVKHYILGFFDSHVLKYIDIRYARPIDYFSFWILTITIAILLYKYFEKPFMEIRERF